MKLPNVVHPKTFVINGIKFQIISYGPLTDEQARKAALHSYSSKKKWTKADKTKIHKALWNLDQDSAGLL